MHILVYAQTIYHYNIVFKVDPKTEEKVFANGKQMHIIYTNSTACLCHEDGTIFKEEDEVNKETRSRYSELVQKIFGKQYNLSFEKNENGMNIYHSYYYYLCSNNIYDYYNHAVGGFLYEWTIEKYLYVSLDKQRINFIKTKTKKGDVETDGIEVYELYDTDEVGKVKDTNINPQSIKSLY